MSVDQKAPRPSRRAMLAGAGLFTLGFHIPFKATAATLGGAPLAPEVNAWVVVKPDETVVIRIARSEMGQGTLTGLAQLVAEELGCPRHHRISEPGPEPRPQARLGRLFHRRQPGRARFP